MTAERASQPGRPRNSASPTSDSARLAILRLLQRRGGLTVKQLEQELGRTTTAVREQLTSLQADGLVQASKVKGELGRPYFLYDITEQGRDLFPKDYGDLTNMLLEEIYALDGQAKISLLMERISTRMATRFADQLTDGQRMQDRLVNLTALLNERGVSVELEQRAEGLVLHSSSCPYFRVARQHREVCDMEQDMLSRTLGSQVSLTSCVLDGSHGCDFSIGSPLTITQVTTKE